MKLAKNKIELALAMKSMNQKELTEKSPLSHSTIVKAIQEKEISPKTAGQIATALDVSVIDLINKKVN